MTPFLNLKRIPIKRQLWAQVAIVTAVRYVTLHARIVAAGVNVVAVVAHKRIVTPTNVAIVKEHVLPLTTVIAAIHHLHVGFGSIGVRASPAISAVIAIGGNGVFGRRGGRMPKLSFCGVVRRVDRRILVCEAIADAPTVWFLITKVCSFCRWDLPRIAESSSNHKIPLLRAGGTQKYIEREVSVAN